ncbi:MAG: hypothetical protein ABSA68_11660 [Xanthobacteraceae bacterium]
MLESAIEDFVDEFRAEKFTRAEIDEHIFKCRTDKPQRWGGRTENDELYVSAFGPKPNYSQQGEIVRKFGEDRAKEIAAEFGTTLGGKPGVVPESIKAKPVDEVKIPGGATNPFSKAGWNLTAQSRLVVALGEAKASAIAKSVGGHLGMTRPVQ